MSTGVYQASHKVWEELEGARYSGPNPPLQGGSWEAAIWTGPATQCRLTFENLGIEGFRLDRPMGTGGVACYKPCPSVPWGSSLQKVVLAERDGFWDQIILLHLKEEAKLEVWQQRLGHGLLGAWFLNPGAERSQRGG